MEEAKSTIKVCHADAIALLSDRYHLLKLSLSHSVPPGIGSIPQAERKDDNAFHTVTFLADHQFTVTDSVLDRRYHLRPIYQFIDTDGKFVSCRTREIPL